VAVTFSLADLGNLVALTVALDDRLNTGNTGVTDASPFLEDTREPVREFLDPPGDCCGELSSILSETRVQ
jgi:hypothetical protein